jgi:hypothetical protein
VFLFEETLHLNEKKKIKISISKNIYMSAPSLSDICNVTFGDGVPIVESFIAKMSQMNNLMNISFTLDPPSCVIMEIDGKVFARLSLDILEKDLNYILENHRFFREK